MTRDQERQILRQNINHYLWHKPRAKWTEDDLAMLERKSIRGTKEPEIIVEVKHKKRQSYKQPVMVKHQEKFQIFESVVSCAAELELEPNTIYAKLNGHQKNEGEYQFFKSKMNEETI